MSLKIARPSESQMRRAGIEEADILRKGIVNLCENSIITEEDALAAVKKIPYYKEILEKE